MGMRVGMPLVAIENSVYVSLHPCADEVIRLASMFASMGRYSQLQSYYIGSYKVSGSHSSSVNLLNYLCFAE